MLVGAANDLEEYSSSILTMHLKPWLPYIMVAKATVESQQWPHLVHTQLVLTVNIGDCVFITIMTLKLS